MQELNVPEWQGLPSYDIAQRAPDDIERLRRETENLKRKREIQEHIDDLNKTIDPRNPSRSIKIKKQIWDLEDYRNKISQAENERNKTEQDRVQSVLERNRTGQDPWKNVGFGQMPVSGGTMTSGGQTTSVPQYGMPNPKIMQQYQQAIAQKPTFAQMQKNPLESIYRTANIPTFSPEQQEQQTQMFGQEKTLYDLQQAELARKATARQNELNRRSKERIAAIEAEKSNKIRDAVLKYSLTPLNIYDKDRPGKVIGKRYPTKEEVALYSNQIETIGIIPQTNTTAPKQQTTFINYKPTAKDQEAYNRLLKYSAKERILKLSRNKDKTKKAGANYEWLIWKLGGGSK
ncbi:MAG: hypothetical protein PHE15_01665 [Dehalococcoidales bacterium]|nr:hypothetical protein [Dehalococcoidales bacterium]